MEKTFLQYSEANNIYVFYMSTSFDKCETDRNLFCAQIVTVTWHALDTIQKQMKPRHRTSVDVTQAFTVERFECTKQNRLL